jgi:hypothetical protein
MIQVMSLTAICFPSSATLRREAVSGTTLTQTMIFMRASLTERSRDAVDAAKGQADGPGTDLARFRKNEAFRP